MAHGHSSWSRLGEEDNLAGALLLCDQPLGIRRRQILVVKKNRK